MADFAKLRKLDGQAASFMFDSQTIQIPAGETILVPIGAAYVALQHFTRRDENGGPLDPDVSMEPYDGAVSLTAEQPAPVQFHFAETGQTFDTQDELVQAMRDFFSQSPAERAEAAAAAKAAPEAGTPTDANGKPLTGAALTAALKKRAEAAA